MPKKWRNNTIRDRHRAVIAADEPPCAECGRAIDYTITDQYDPWVFTVDHVVPLALGGSDLLANKQAMHRLCNLKKGDRLPGCTTSKQRPAPRTGRDSTYEPTTALARGIPADQLPPGVTFVTGRDW